jgi:hypothetical protein
MIITSEIYKFKIRENTKDIKYEKLKIINDKVKIRENTKDIKYEKLKIIIKGD